MNAADPTKGGWGRFSSCLLASTWACKFRNIGEVMHQLHLRHQPEHSLLTADLLQSKLLTLKQHIWFKTTFSAFTQIFLPKSGSLCICHFSDLFLPPAPSPSILVPTAVGTDFITWEKCPAHTPCCYLKQTKKIKVFWAENPCQDKK